MASFETDLARYLAAAEREEFAHEAKIADLDANVPAWEQAEQQSDPDHNPNGRFVSADDVKAPHEPTVRRYGNDDPGRLIPGVDGEGLY
jgi:hypothetical protein